MVPIRVKDFYFRFKNSSGWVLNGINLNVEPGDKVAIFGANGAGKTTLLINILLLPKGISKGEIRVDDIVVSKTTVKNVREIVGIVFQNPSDQLLFPTVYELLSYRLEQLGKKEREEKIDYILDLLGLAQYKYFNVWKLSEGEKKKVVLAEAMIRDTKALLLDEPSSMLDPASCRELIGILSQLRQTLLIATHDIWFAEKVCNKGIILNQGKIVWEGRLDRLPEEEVLKRYRLA